LTVSSKTLHLFGIKACDTMKKARTWLDEHGLSYEFHDYKTAGIDREHLTQWCNEHGWQVVDLGDRTLIGFKPDSYSAALK
jgi:arsenate reductase (glutaredoxin)